MDRTKMATTSIIGTASHHKGEKGAVSGVCSAVRALAVPFEVFSPAEIPSAAAARSDTVFLKRNADAAKAGCINSASAMIIARIFTRIFFNCLSTPQSFLQVPHAFSSFGDAKKKSHHRRIHISDCSYSLENHYTFIE
jgi:hypothetical protein